MIKGKGFLWQSQLQIGIRKLSPFTPHSQFPGCELNKDLAPPALGSKGTACYLGESALTCLNSLPLQNLKSSDGGREMLMVMVVAKMLMKEENGGGECHLQI